MTAKSSDDCAEAAAGGRLRMIDAVSLIIGIVVGTAIFRAPPMVFASVPSAAAGLAMWVVGGLLSIAGALCYCELATTWPRSGGDYVYQSEAYGRVAGFLFGWAQVTVILTGSIGTMAYTFGDYFGELVPAAGDSLVIISAAAVVVLTAVNLVGTVSGTRTQNLLTLAKLLGFATVIGGGFFSTTQQPALPVANTPAALNPQWGLALVFVLYAYGGWNDAAFVAAEVRDRRKNIPLALLLGVAGIAALYLAVNWSYLQVLGLDGVRTTATPASDAAQRAFGASGRVFVSMLVMISALGAINGMLLTGTRVAAALGDDHPLFAQLGRRDRRGTPVAAFLVLCGVSVGLILLVGTAAGQAALDRILQAITGRTVPWDRYFGGFETLLAATAPAFWVLFLMTGIAVFVLRRRRPDQPLGFRVPGYPVTPLLFCGMCVFMLQASIRYAQWLTLLGFVPLLLGIPCYWVSERMRGGSR